jgi:hypothetical protein
LLESIQEAVGQGLQTVATAQAQPQAAVQRVCAIGEEVNVVVPYLTQKINGKSNELFSTAAGNLTELIQ